MAMVQRMKKKITFFTAAGVAAIGSMAAPIVSADAPSENAAKEAQAEEASKKNPVEAGQISHILVSGNQKIPSDAILRYVSNTKVGDDYDRNIVMKDVKAISESGLVQSVRAKALLSNGELYVVFEIQELAEVSSISFTGNTLLSDEQLRPLIGSKEGEGFSQETVRQDIENIRNAYSDAGYIAVVSDVNNNNGMVTYTINEAKVGGIQYTGNEKTKTWVLEKLVSPYIQEGTLLRNDSLQAAYNALAGSGYFSDVKIDATDIKEEPGSVMLNVIVTETSTGAWNIGGAYSDTYGAELVGGIYDKNLGGTAKTLSLDFGIGTERDHYSLTYTDPYWKKSNTSVYAQAFKTDKDVDNDYYEYTEEHTGGEIGFQKPVSRDGRTSMYANFRVDNIEVSGQEKGEKLEGIQDNSLTIGVIHDNRNAAGSGSILEAAVTTSQEFFGSDEDFTKFLLSAKGYKRLSDRDVLAARGVINYSPDSLPGVEQFTIGGADTVRGMEEDEQRGDKSVLASVELRHDFTDKLQGVVFADVGKAWSEEIDNDLKAAAGLGLRVKTALGVLRLDAAKAGGDTVKFLFGIGQSF